MPPAHDRVALDCLVHARDKWGDTVGYGRRQDDPVFHTICGLSYVVDRPKGVYRLGMETRASTTCLWCAAGSKLPWRR